MVCSGVPKTCLEAMTQTEHIPNSATVTLSLFRFETLADRLWVFAQMGLARPALSRVPGLDFYKLMGSGTGEGFTPVPNTAVWGILAAWRDGAAAQSALRGASVFGRWQARAAEHWTLALEPISVRGKWSERTPFQEGPDSGRGPIVALTRATIRPRHARAFWARSGPISDVIGNDSSVLFKIGIGEVPFFHQVTFSIWPDSASMAAFARKDGPHARAIAAVRAGDWFSEELYARFRIAASYGTWNGGAPPVAAPQQTAPDMAPQTMASEAATT